MDTATAKMAQAIGAEEDYWKAYWQERQRELRAKKLAWFEQAMVAAGYDGPTFTGEGK